MPSGIVVLGLLKIPIGFASSGWVLNAPQLTVRVLLTLGISTVELDEVLQGRNKCGTSHLGQWLWEYTE